MEKPEIMIAFHWTGYGLVLVSTDPAESVNLPQDFLSLQNEISRPRSVCKLES